MMRHASKFLECGESVKCKFLQLTSVPISDAESYDKCFGLFVAFEQQYSVRFYSTRKIVRAVGSSLTVCTENYSLPGTCEMDN